jgi:hypothetical protein
MTWYYQNNIIDHIDPEYKAFVYLITNLLTGQQYIGLKQTYVRKTKLVKGQKKRYIIESDWKTYWSSSDQVKNDVLQYGEHNFKREILYLCKLKAHANYLEAREQMERRVLEDPNRYYNRIINVRVSHNHILKFLKDQKDAKI